jgi:hypothetical protein
MDGLAKQRKDLTYDKEFIDPIRELKESVDAMPWYTMNVNSNGQLVNVIGKGKTLHYPDGWRVQYCQYDLGDHIKKVIQISVQGYLWSDIPKDFRHGRANVILDAIFNPDLNVTETAILPHGGIQISQDHPHWRLFTDNKRELH